MTQKIKKARVQPSAIVLIVDDDETVRGFIHSILSPDYFIIQASDGQEALEKLQNSRPDLIPDLIISDIKMPRMDGYKLLQHVKSSPLLRHIPMLLFTGQDSQAERLESLSAGADDYLSKPFNHKELLIRVKNLIKIRQQEKELLRLNEELQKKVSEQLDIIIKNKRLTRFFPQKLVKWILSAEKDLELTSEKKLLTIFFSDLSGFTELGEKSSPEVMRTVLNDYFTHMVDIVEQFEGTLDKFIGDGLMVFFGAPDVMDTQEQAVRAVSMAIAMQKKMKVLAEEWRQQGIFHNIKIRMGIHQDNVMVGNFGSQQLMEYTVIGTGVNLANRLESYCEPEKILVSAPVYDHTKELFQYKEIVLQRLRGFERLVPVSQLDPPADSAH